MDHKQFQKVYLQLNSQASHLHAKDAADKAFASADQSHDRNMTFDEFLWFYILHKSPPQNIQNFLTDIHGNDSIITLHQAEHYSKFFNNFYGKPAGALQPAHIGKNLAATHGNDIPIQSFVNHTFKSIIITIISQIENEPRQI